MCSTDVSEAMQNEPWPNDMFAARAPVSPVFPERGGWWPWDGGGIYG